MARVMMIVMVKMMTLERACHNHDLDGEDGTLERACHGIRAFPIRTQTLEPYGKHPDEYLRQRRTPSLARTRSAKDNARNVTLCASSPCSVGAEDLIGCQVRAWWILLLPTPVALLLLLEIEQQLVRVFILAAGAIDADA